MFMFHIFTDMIVEMRLIERNYSQQGINNLTNFDFATFDVQG